VKQVLYPTNNDVESTKIDTYCCKNACIPDEGEAYIASQQQERRDGAGVVHAPAEGAVLDLDMVVKDGLTRRPSHGRSKAERLV
jgi:hypothetical protein